VLERIAERRGRKKAEIGPPAEGQGEGEKLKSEVFP